jgi:cellulose synthase/poly-beta-1,6-N-acetylglucosamine synthase-like glycosyltransferase
VNFFTRDDSQSRGSGLAIAGGATVTSRMSESLVDSRESPTVSILTPAYNSAKFIRQTLDSVLRQTFTDFEMIVVDDGSTDETRSIVDEYAARDSRIRVLTQLNAGIAAARNRAMRAARGRFFTLLDSDDLWLPGYLAEQLAILDDRPDVAVLSANAINFGGSFDGAPLLPIRAHGRIRLVSLLELVTVEDSLCILSMFRREVTDVIGGFDTSLWRSEDYDLWLRAAVAGYRIAVNPKPLGLYRRRPDSVSADEVLMLEAMKVPLIKVRGLCAHRPEVTAAVDRQLARFGQRCLMASARSALLDGDMSAFATHLGALATQTGATRYRFARWLSSISPAAIKWAYVCKRAWAHVVRPGRVSRARLHPWVDHRSSAERGVKVAQHALRKMRLEGDVQ